MEEKKLTNPGQQITINSESHEELLHTPSVKEEKAMTAQGMVQKTNPSYKLSF